MLVSESVAVVALSMWTSVFIRSITGFKQRYEVSLEIFGLLMTGVGTIFKHLWVSDIKNKTNEKHQHRRLAINLANIRMGVGWLGKAPYASQLKKKKKVNKEQLHVDVCISLTCIRRFGQ